MLTTNNFTIEAIVAKYVTAINSAAEKHGVNNPDYPMAVNEMESYSPEQQLITKLWFEHEGHPLEMAILDDLKVYLQFYKESILTEKELSFLLENYRDSIEYIFSNRDHWTYREMVFAEVPKEIADLAAAILKLDEGQSIFLPLCGYGDVAVKFPKCKILGFVESRTVAALVQIRLAASGIKAEISTKVPSSEERYSILPKEKVDFIFCNLFNAEYFDFLFHGFNLENLYDILKESGKMLSLTPNKVITSLGEEYSALRKRLCAEKSVEAIVQMPEGILKDTKASSFLLVIDKQMYGTEREGVVMYNASFASRAYSAHSELKRIDVDSFLSTIRNANIPEHEDIIRRIAYHDIDPEIMMPGYYLIERKENSNRRLTDLVDLVRGDRNEPEEKHYSYSVKGCLSSEFKNAKLSLERLDESASSVSVPGRYYLCHSVEPCIFLAIAGKEIMIGYSTKSDSDAFYRVLPTVMCLKVKNGISVEYVAALLLSEEIKEQLLAIGAGSVTRYLNHHLLSAIIVPDHSKEQMSLFLEQVLKESMSQREKDIKSERETYERNVRLRKHALTQSVSSFGAMFNTLNKCRIRQGGILHDGDKISPVSDKSVAEVFDTLSSRLSSILEKLAHIADVDIDYGKSEDIDPEDFILRYIQSKKDGWLNFKGVADWPTNIRFNKNIEDLHSPEDNSLIIAAGDTLHSFYFPKAALEHIFNNIVANAQAHGFTDDRKSDYAIRFSWEVKGLDVIINIENNGDPLPNGVDPKDILSYGYSTKLNHDGHNGIGGSEIASIMKEYHGEVEVQSCPSSDFPVKYVLRFHDTNIVGSF